MLFRVSWPQATTLFGNAILPHRNQVQRGVEEAQAIHVDFVVGTDIPGGASGGLSTADAHEIQQRVESHH
jgi:hypothetical protein